MSINKAVISGNLTRDSELRRLGSGSCVLNFGVAVNDRVKNQQTGEWEDRPNFVDCVIFGARAEKLAQYLTKGAKVAVEGRLRYSAWEKDGQRRSKLEVVVDELEFLTSRDRQFAAPSPAPAAIQYPQTMPQPVSVYDEDIPF
ncbi:MAG: single-stranded DNA-binding protein [Bacteroides sp.]|nr:single-stranded DNA-binding protein [Bacteroides sp.]